MHIVVNSIYLHGFHPDNASFIADLFGYLTHKYPEHHFYFLVDKSSNHHYPTAENATVMPIDYSIKSFVSLNIWINIKLPLLLKKLQATVLIQPNGLCCMATNIPQILVVSDNNWLQQPKSLPAALRLFHRFFGKKGIQKAAQLITFSQNIQQQIISQYPITQNKIINISLAASPLFQPISQEQKQQTKDGYADGRSYFLFTGGNNPNKNLVGLLKAFSSFKRWQKSNMKLVVTGTITPQKDDVLKKLNTYKYKDDVVILPTLTEQQLAVITAAAYAFIIPSLTDELALPMLSAMQSGIPVIANNLESMTEIGGDSCLYASPNEVDEMANQLKLLYRDEQLHTSLSAKGLQRAATYNWEKTAGLFWDALLKA